MEIFIDSTLLWPVLIHLAVLIIPLQIGKQCVYEFLKFLRSKFWVLKLSFQVLCFGKTWEHHEMRLCFQLFFQVKPTLVYEFRQLIWFRPRDAAQQCPIVVGRFPWLKESSFRLLSHPFLYWRLSSSSCTWISNFLHVPLNSESLLPTVQSFVSEEHFPLEVLLHVRGGLSSYLKSYRCLVDLSCWTS